MKRRNRLIIDLLQLGNVLLAHLPAVHKVLEHVHQIRSHVLVNECILLEEVAAVQAKEGARLHLRTVEEVSRLKRHDAVVLRIGVEKGVDGMVSRCGMPKWRSLVRKSRGYKIRCAGAVSARTPPLIVF